MDLQEVGCGGMDWFAEVYDRDRWRAIVKAVMKLKVSKSAANFFAENLLASQEGPCSMELVNQII